MWLSQKNPRRLPECACVSVSMSEPRLPLGFPEAKGRLTMGLVLGSGRVRTEGLAAERPAGVRLQHSQELGLLCSIMGLSYAGLPRLSTSSAPASAVAAKEGQEERRREERNWWAWWQKRRPQGLGPRGPSLLLVLPTNRPRLASSSEGCRKVFLSGQGQCMLLNILNIPLGIKHSTCQCPGAGEGLASWKKKRPLCLGQSEQGGEGQETGRRVIWRLLSQCRGCDGVSLWEWLQHDFENSKRGSEGGTAADLRHSVQ